MDHRHSGNGRKIQQRTVGLDFTVCGLVQGEGLVQPAKHKLQELAEVLVPHFFRDGNCGRALAATFARGIPFSPLEHKVSTPPRPFSPLLCLWKLVNACVLCVSLFMFTNLLHIIISIRIFPSLIITIIIIIISLLLVCSCFILITTSTLWLSHPHRHRDLDS
jgi:hypothetical protein